MECIILAGGLGTRLRSVVSDLPKCMAPVAGHPFLYYVLRYLAQQGANHVILSVGYKHEVIEAWVNSHEWPFAVSYAIETEPLGTGGAIKLSLQKAIEAQVLILNGDTFFDINLVKFVNAHNSANADLSIALKPMTDFDRYGNVDMDNACRITSFLEKQFCAKGQINGGTYVVNRSTDLMDNLPAKFSFETDVMQRLFRERCFCGFVNDGYFIDIGIPEDFEKANIEFGTLFAC